MKAKQLFQSINEADEEVPGGAPLPSGRPPVPGQASGPRQAMRRPGPRYPDPEAVMQQRLRHGGMPPEPEPEGPFTRDDLNKLAFVLLLITSKNSGNDSAITRKLIAKQPLNQGDLQHIMDEIRQVPDVPKEFDAVLEKVYKMI